MNLAEILQEIKLGNVFSFISYRLNGFGLMTCSDE
jgi:hypothetical protein